MFPCACPFAYLVGTRSAPRSPRRRQRWTTQRWAAWLCGLQSGVLSFVALQGESGYSTFDWKRRPLTLAQKRSAHFLFTQTLAMCRVKVSPLVGGRLELSTVLKELRPTGEGVIYTQTLTCAFLISLVHITITPHPLLFLLHHAITLLLVEQGCLPLSVTLAITGTINQTPSGIRDLLTVAPNNHTHTTSPLTFPSGKRSLAVSCAATGAPSGPPTRVRPKAPGGV